MTEVLFDSIACTSQKPLMVLKLDIPPDPSGLPALPFRRGRALAIGERLD